MKALWLTGIILLSFATSAFAEEDIRTYSAVEKYKIITNVLASEKVDAKTKELLTQVVNGNAEKTTALLNFSCYSIGRSLNVGCVIRIGEDDLTDDDSGWGSVWEISVLLIDRPELVIRRVVTTLDAG